MPGLDSIPVLVEQSQNELLEWGNALPILHEIRHGLQRLDDLGETMLIDLHSMPFGPGDEDRLFALLGRGEVEARLEAFGTTEIWETAVPGTWVVDHRNAEGERIALHVEITTVPDILRTQPQDLRGAVAALDARIAAGVKS